MTIQEMTAKLQTELGDHLSLAQEYRVIEAALREAQQLAEKCSFRERASRHSGSFTTGIGTFCSTCHERIYNENFDGRTDGNDRT